MHYNMGNVTAKKLLLIVSVVLGIGVLSCPGSGGTGTSTQSVTKTEPPKTPSPPKIPAPSKPKVWYVTTIAGGSRGYNDATGADAQFDKPSGMAMADDGSLYVTDSLNHRIRKINPATGAVSTIAGGGTEAGDTTLAKSQFSQPFGIAVASNDVLYVADTYNNRIRKIDIANDTVTTVASNFKDDTGNIATFNHPDAVLVASDGSLYVADQNSHRILKINFTTSKVETIAGSGARGYNDAVGTAAQFDAPAGMAIAADGALYVADYSNHCIRKIDVTTKNVETIAEDFQDEDGKTATFKGPNEIAVAQDGSLYVTDSENKRIQKIDFDTKKVITVVKSFKDENGSVVEFGFPDGIALVNDSLLYVVDYTAHVIRKLEYK